MDPNDLWRAGVLRPVLCGLRTGDTVYLTTHSGLCIRFAAGGGLLLAVQGGDTASVVDSSGTEPVDGHGLSREAWGL